MSTLLSIILTVKRFAEDFYMNTNFAAYIQAQKMRIRAERADEIDFISRGGVVTLGGAVAAVRDAEDILSEMDGLRGLNTRERARLRTVRGAKLCTAA